ncbi:GTPase IMAP family member 2-like [Coturnix japonica]|uniref:GTPase IMAP family member 2-like n=1 Tax=Coturnix japonica TaxID=93934 RepID=UPI000777ADCB|nr:GTPase IMAP family member 2-like [Coturnix japonica]
MADRAAETRASGLPRSRTSSESPAEAAGPRRSGMGREEDGSEGSKSKRRESGERPELRVVLLGRSGAGRSATGNTLLCQELFESRLASQPVTTTCAKGRRDWGEWSVVVMDTPAIVGGSQWDKQQLAKERDNCRSFAAHEHCVLLLVTQLGRYTREDREVQKGVKKFFGKDAEKRMMVVFTRKEDLGDGVLEEYVRTADNGALQKLVNACGEHYCAVSNTVPRQDRDAQADEVLKMAEGIALRQHTKPCGKEDLGTRVSKFFNTLKGGERELEPDKGRSSNEMRK